MSVVSFKISGKPKSKTGSGVVRGFPPTTTLDVFSKGYVNCALWESYDTTTGRPFGLNFTITEIAPVSLRRMAQDCLHFQFNNHQSLMACYGPSYSRTEAGRDFWLTRNRQTEGFECRLVIPLAMRVILTQAALDWPPYALTIGPKQTLLGD